MSKFKEAISKRFEMKGVLCGLNAEEMLEHCWKIISMVVYHHPLVGRSIGGWGSRSRIQAARRCCSSKGCGIDNATYNQVPTIIKGSKSHHFFMARPGSELVVSKV